jgi:hypothetical protein
MESAHDTFTPPTNDLRYLAGKRRSRRGMVIPLPRLDPTRYIFIAAIVAQ